jgi:hypothetical protein
MTAPVRSVAGLLGGSKELALFEALAVRNDSSLSAAEISRLSGVSWATTHRRLDTWEALGVVRAAEKVGKAQKYVLNLASPGIRALAQAVNITIAEIFESAILHEGVPLDTANPAPALVEVTDWSTDQFEWENRPEPTVSWDGIRSAPRAA